MTTRRVTVRRFRGGSTPRRRRSWANALQINGTGLAPDTFQVVQLLPFASSAEGTGFQAAGMVREGFTLVRTLIDGNIFIPDPGTVDSGTLWYGGLQMSQQALASGGHALPGIDNADWFILGCKSVRHRSLVLAGFDPLSVARVEIDLRAMRKVSAPENAMTFIIRNDENSVGNVGYEFCLRSLWLLP